MATETEYKEPTSAQITDWKKKHKEVFCIEVEADNKEFLKAFMRRPGLREMQIAAASEKKKAGSFAESIFENCKLDVHPEIKNNDKYYVSALSQIDEIVEFANVSVKKL